MNNLREMHISYCILGFYFLIFHGENNEVFIFITMYKVQGLGDIRAVYLMGASVGVLIALYFLDLLGHYLKPAELRINE